MNHPAEIKIHRYLEDVRKGKRGMSSATLARVIRDMQEALEKQFNQPRSKEFNLRMSSIGRPYCQLWYSKNDPDGAIEPSANFMMNMMIGDIVEAVFKGVLTEAGIDFSDGFKSVLKVGEHRIPGTHDLIMDKKVDDVKSASPWSYTNKFKDFNTLAEGDSFGYVGQLAGYAKALNVGVGGWWVVNKGTGEFKYVSAEAMDLDSEINKIEEKADKLKSNVFERCFEPVKETFRGKETGNTLLNPGCKFCDHRYKCWDTLQEVPSKVSQAKEKPIVSYISIKQEPTTTKTTKKSSGVTDGNKATTQSKPKRRTTKRT